MFALRKFEKRNVQQLVHEFHAEYKNWNFGNAYRLFMEALEADADYAYREIATQSGAIASVAEKLGKISEVTQKLDVAFAANPRMHLLFENKPRQLDAFCNLREDKISKGLPSAVLVSMGKSASVAVGNIFHSGFGLPSFAYSFLNFSVVPSWAKDYARGGACYVTHLLPFPENIRRLKEAGLNRVIVQVRDPRQVLLSFIHHRQRYHAHYPDKAPDTFSKDVLFTPTEEEMGLYYSFIGWIQGWLKAAEELEIHFSTFEEFVTDREKFIQGYVDFYGHEKHFDHTLAVTENTSVDNHKRLGQTDEWRSIFTQEQQDRLGSLLPQEVREHFGWEK